MVEAQELRASSVGEAHAIGGRGRFGAVLRVMRRRLEVASDELASIDRTQDEAIDDRVAKRLDKVEGERWSAIGWRVNQAKGRVEAARDGDSGEFADEK